MAPIIWGESRVAQDSVLGPELSNTFINDLWMKEERECSSNSQVRPSLERKIADTLEDIIMGP